MSAQPAPPRPTPDHRRSSTAPKRTSILPKPTSIVLDSSVLVAQHAQLTGTQPITIGAHAVLHPHSKISSASAPVVLGEGCVVFERAKVGVGVGPEPDVESRRGTRDSMRSEGTVLERNVVVESNSIVEAAEVGEGTVVEVGARLGRGCTVGKFCTISPSSVVAPYTHIPDYTVVFGGDQQRVDRTLLLRPELLEARVTVHKKQLDMFKKLIPNNIAKWT